MYDLNENKEFETVQPQYPQNSQYSQYQQYQYLQAPQKKPRKTHTTAKVMALITGVAVVCGGTSFAGTYFAGKHLNSSVVRQDTSSNNSSYSNYQGNRVDGENGSAPTLSELQQGITSPTTNSTVEYNSDGTYKYTRDLVDAVSDSVVCVNVYITSNGKTTVYGMGSGIIISKDGYIVTNSHVVEYGDVFTVKVNDAKNGGESKTYEAALIGRDGETDLAVLKIDATNLPAAVLGDSDELHIGDDCFAIGNPFGLETSVSKGIISGLNRQISTSEYALTSIQTDAALNHGNSGGALFNGYGEVIGIVNEKYVVNDAESLGFAITINDAKSIINELLLKGYVPGKAIIGITYTFISEENAEIYGIPAGMLIRSIDSSLAIGKSSLKVGDTIIAINGESTITGDISKMLTENEPGDVVVLTVIREGDTSCTPVDIEVELSEDSRN